MTENISNKRKIVKVNSPEDIFQMAKIDYTKLVIGCYDNVSFDYTFPVTPSDYLRYANSDFEEGRERGLINALSNAKRCIDCLIETVLKSVGINPENIPQTALTFCEEILRDEERNLMPLSLRLFCALGFAPSFLISEVRLLRNKVEHEYEIPKTNDVRKAIEVADLLLNNVKAKETYSSTIDITDVKKDKNLSDRFGAVSGIYFDEKHYIKKGKELYIEKKDGRCTFNLSIVMDDSQEELEYIFKGDELIFFFLLRAMFIAYHDEASLIKTIKLMLQHVNIKAPKEYIKVVQTYR